MLTAVHAYSPSDSYTYTQRGHTPLHACGARVITTPRQKRFSARSSGVPPPAPGALSGNVRANTHPHDVCLHRGEPLIWLFLPFEFKYDLCRLEDDHVTAALFAPAAPPSVLADAASSTLLADAAHPPVLAEAAAPALLALVALPAVLADAGAAALLAVAAPPAVLTDAAAAALLSLHVLRRRPCSQMPLPGRTPCTRCAAARARRCCYHRTPCTGCGADREGTASGEPTDTDRARSLWAR
eukprot:scaffold100225_cov62-Phaeocystis_antarctica.AAC.2